MVTYEKFLKYELKRLKKARLEMLELHKPSSTKSLRENTDFMAILQLFFKHVIKEQCNLKAITDHIELLKIFSHVFKDYTPDEIMEDFFEKEISIKITIKEMLNLSSDLYDLSVLKREEKKLLSAMEEFHNSEGRTEKRWKKFSNRIGLTNGKRQSKQDNEAIFFNYVQLVKGIGSEKMSKSDAFQTIKEKWKLTDEGLKSILKNQHALYSGYFKGLLPH